MLNPQLLRVIPFLFISGWFLSTIRVIHFAGILGVLK